MLSYSNQVLAKQGAGQVFLLSLFFVCVLGLLDYLIGPEYSFSVFYTAPIMMAGWYGGKRYGLVLAFTSSFVWLAADLAAGFAYSTLLVPAWNTFVRLAFFIIILALLLVIKDKLSLEESLADTDPLTGLANRRFFLEQLEREHTRLRRYPSPITIAFVDLDNFKYVNDTFGHDIGDQLLIQVSRTMRENIRASDFVARLGGDEFVLLFPLLDKSVAESTIGKLQSELQSKMDENQWPVSFSIGVVTFESPLTTSRDMLKLVDDLMYEVKKSGKNNTRFEVVKKAQ